MKKKRSRTVIVMPAYNAEKTLRKTYDEMPRLNRGLVVLVDDGSRDKTVKLAKSLGLEVFIHPQNRGYGANQKTCYDLALNKGGQIIVMLHPDYQYDPKLIPELIRPIEQGRVDIMLGSRIRSRKEALEGGMPVYKYLGNRALTMLENLITGRNLSEYHTGYRAYDRRVLEKLPYHLFSDNFVFDQQILISAIEAGFKIGEIAVPVRYFPQASSINFARSVKYGIDTLVCLGEFVLNMWGMYRSKIFS